MIYLNNILTVVMELVVRKSFCLRAEINCVIFSVTNKFIIFNGIPNSMTCFIMNVMTFLIVKQNR